LQDLSSAEQSRAFVPFILRNGIFYDHEEYRYVIPRYLELLWHLPPQLAGSPDFTDIRRVFKTATGVQLDTYLRFGAALLASVHVIAANRQGPSLLNLRTLRPARPSGHRPVDHSITGPFQPNVVMGVDSKGSRLLAGDSVRGRLLSATVHARRRSALVTGGSSKRRRSCRLMCAASRMSALFLNACGRAMVVPGRRAHHQRRVILSVIAPRHPFLVMR
jgi:hypothetical protein